jgi:hypothetical protein
MGKELPDLFGPPISGMTFVMKQDEALDPLHIGFFGADTITFHADDLPHLIKKPRVSTSIGVTCLNHTVVSS